MSKFDPGRDSTRSIFREISPPLGLLHDVAHTHRQEVTRPAAKKSVSVDYLDDCD